MSTRGPLFPVPTRLILGALLALATGASSVAAQAPPAPAGAEFLPDSFVILRIGDRPVTVAEYLERWFNTWPEDRPTTDSTGRVQFLNTLTNRQLMAVAAKRGNPVLPFEQRNQLRAYRNHILAYVLRLRTVDDSVQVTAEDLERIRVLTRSDFRYQFVVFEDHAMASSARRELVANPKALDKVRRNYMTVTQEWDENAWITAHRMHPQHAAIIAGLDPGQISRPFVVPGGVALIHLLETRPGTEYASNAIVVANFMRSLRTEDRTEEVMAGLRRHAGVVYDSTNIRWLAAQFQKSARPRIALADTGRVLAQTPTMRFSVRSFTHDYLERPAVLRPDVSTTDLLRRAIDDLILEPAKVTLAVSRGLEQDPVTLRLMEERRETLLIEAFFRDSIAAKVQPKPAERRRYYDQNVTKYLTYATAHYVVLRGPTLAEASLLATRVRAGEKPTDLLDEVTANGKRVGRVGELRENEQDPYHGVLFEELRPGELKLFGPDENGEFFVLQLTAFDAGRQLSYEEAETYVDESVRNLMADQLLEKFLEREKRGVRIESHPEQVMRIRLKDPTL